MGGCCSKCDRYLLKGDPVDAKVGDTPKLARVSHSASFSGDKTNIDTPSNRLVIITIMIIKNSCKTLHIAIPEKNILENRH